MSAPQRNPKMAEDDPTRSTIDHMRRAERRALRATVHYRKGQAKATVDLIDISTHGARLATALAMRPGEIFWIKLPNLANQEARVAWRDGFVVGCEFLAPLHPSVVDSLIR